MGSLNSLGARLEEVRNLLTDLRNAPDIDHRVAVAIHSEWPDDLIIRLAQLRKELSYHYEGKKRTEVGVVDILWAVDALDHLDTLGLALTTKGYG